VQYEKRGMTSRPVVIQTAAKSNTGKAASVTSINEDQAAKEIFKCVSDSLHFFIFLRYFRSLCLA
jgi:hypothetical protein